MKKGLVLLLMVFSVSVFADKGQNRPTGLDEPGKILTKGFMQLSHFFQRPGSQSSDAVEGFVNQTIAPYFDFGYMTQWAAGHKYKRLDAKEKNRMKNYLQRSFLSSLVKSLSSYDGQRIQVLKARPGRSGKEVTVTVMIQQAGNYYPSKVNFRFYHNGRQWKVFDVSANGSSAVVHYRKVFAQQAKAKRQRELIQQRQQRR
jgi:phospholipid transport system substrate-binding protein